MERQFIFWLPEVMKIEEKDHNIISEYEGEESGSVNVKM